jgi:hypothetical protein
MMKKLSAISMVCLVLTLKGYGDEKLPDAKPSALSTLSYGDVLLAQEPKDAKHTFDLSLQYRAGLSSPQFLLSGANLGLDFWALRELLVGLNFGAYLAEPTALQNALSEELKVNAVSIKYASPKYTLYGQVGYSPLRGLINVFGRHIVRSDLIFGTGIGTTQYSDGQFYLGFNLFVEERLLIYRSLGVSFGYTQFFEKVSGLKGISWLGRGQLQVGMYVEI